MLPISWLYAGNKLAIQHFLVATPHFAQRTEQGVFDKYFSNTPQDFYISK